MLRTLIVVVFVTLLSSSAFAERRVALVMGADDYEFIRPLDNAVNDARAIEAALEGLGFDVVLETDRDLKRMRRALDDFREDAKGADVALVFFAGHGVEVSGENRLLPTDAEVETLDKLDATTLPLEEVRAAVAEVGKVGLILLDACRNDPFGSTGQKGRGAVSIAPEVLKVVKPGLGRIGRAENILFAFSAAPGETASDGEGNSPFATALTKYLGTEGLEIRSVLTLVQQEVYDFSRGAQLPYVESGLPQLFFAAGGGDLPERERLLLAMAEVTPDLRAEIEQIATDASMPLAPLYGALLEANAAALPQTERVAKLQEAASAFVKVREELKAMASSDPEVERLRGEAEGQLALGAFDTAREKLELAADIDSKSRDALKTNLVERTLSEAATRYIAGGAAKAELRYDLAIADLEKAVALYGDAGDAAFAAEHADRRLSALFNLGELYVTVGNVSAATRAYEALQAVMEKLVADPSVDVGHLRDFAITHMKLGNVRETQGDLSAALEHFEASRDTLLKVVAKEPNDAEWQSDLAVAYEEIGDALYDRGELMPAIGTYNEGLVLKAKLLAADPQSLSRQRDLTTSYDALGMVLRDLGQIEDALFAFNTSLDMRKGIVAADPDHFGRQRDLSISYDKVGDVLRDKRDYDGALASYRAGRDIVEKLAARDPNEKQYVRDISVAGDKIGNVLDDQGDLDGALASYRASNDVISALAASDPDNSTWQRDLSVSLEKVADMLRKQGDLEAGLSNYEQSLVIVRKLTASDPTNANWQRDLSVTLGEIGNIHVDLRHLQPATDALKESLEIRERLVATTPGNARWQRDLALALADWAQVGPKKRQTLERALSIMETLRGNGQVPADDPMISYLEKRLARLKD
ncbi:MAG TPA: caspase family protein [Rhizobiaceae bacterium]|nr:caspase family protein [Rhizobiaceae bacterium]